MNLQRAVKKIMAPLERRVRLMVARGIVRVASNGVGIQALQLQLGLTEVADKVEYFQHYGFTSSLLPSSEVIAAFVGGSRSHGVVLGSRDRKFGVQPVADGQVLIWDNKGNQVWLKEDGIFVVSPAKVDVAAPVVNITATDVNVVASGALSVEVAGAATIAVEGETTLECAGDLNIDVAGETSLESTGNLRITAPATQIIGQLHVTGDVVAGAGEEPVGCVGLLEHTHPTPAGESGPPAGQFGCPVVSP